MRLSKHTRPSWLTAALSVPLVLAACSSPAAAPASGGQQAAPTTAPAAASGEKVGLRFAWWGSQDRHDRTIKVIQMFEQQHPNITITYEFAGFNDYFTKMSTYATGGNLPDLMQQDYATINQWTQNGLIVPLDDYVTDRTINLTD